MSAKVGGLVLAAGAATRFGSQKQLALLDGRPLLEHVLLAFARAHLDRTVVVLGSGASEVLAAVELHGAEPVVCEDWSEGVAASLRAGVAALADMDGVVVALGDQPWLTAAAIERVAAAPADADAARASYDGVPGHPVLLRRSLYDEVAGLRGDQGARELLARTAVADIPCDGLGTPHDVDTQSDLEVVRR